MNMKDAEDAAKRYGDEMTALEDAWGSDRSTWPTGQLERYERVKMAFGRAVTEIEDMDRAESARQAKQDQLRATIASGNYKLEHGFSAPDFDAPTRTRSNPWSAGSGDDLTRVDSPTGLHTRAMDAVEYAHGLPSHSRELLAGLLTRDQSPQAAALVIAATSDEYRSAFGKVLRDSQRGHLLWTEPEREAFARVEACRTAMSLTAANGGYLVPFSLDPTVIMANAGATNPLRAISRVETTLTNTWNGVTSAGVTAEWLSEGSAASDASPTFDRLTITPHKGAAYLISSYELAEDSNLAAQLPQLIADARARQEATAFISGNGTTQPLGVITAVAATTASRVAPTTGGTFTAASEVYKVWDALTPRSRQSDRLAFVANNSIISKVRQFDVYGGSAFIASLGDRQPPALLGAPLFEASAMDSAVTTGSNALLAGDFREFIIVDRIGTTIADVPMVVDGDGKPTYQRGWAAYWRVGSAVADPAAFRLLVL